MSQASYVLWYTQADLEKLNPVRLLKSTPEIIGMERALTVYRNDLEEHIAMEFLASELYRLYEPDAILWAEADHAKLGKRVSRAIKEGIPESVHGNVIPDRPFLRIGSGCTFADCSDDEPTEISYTAAVGIWCYSTPADTDEMRRLVLKLPKIRKEKARLEKVFGPLQEAFYLIF